MDIRFFIEYEKEVAQLPVNPPSIKIPSYSNNSTIEIVKLGEVNILRDVKLSEIEIASLLPGSQDYPFVLTKGDFKKPLYYVKLFTRIQREKKPCRLVVTGLNLNMLVSIESFDPTINAGEEDDVYYTLQLKEYRTYTVKTMVVKNTKSRASQSVKSKSTKPQAYTKIPERPNMSNHIVVGSDVNVSGQLYRDSSGGGPGKTLSHYKGKVNLISKLGLCMYHITTQDGGWLGWVRKDGVTIV